MQFSVWKRLLKAKNMMNTGNLIILNGVAAEIFSPISAYSDCFFFMKLTHITSTHKF